MRNKVLMLGAALACILLLFPGCSNELSQQVADLESKLKASELALKASYEAIKLQEESLREFEAKTQQLTEVLTNSTARLKAAQERIAAYEALEQSRSPEAGPPREAALPAQISVPPPVVFQTNWNGVMETVTFIKKLVGPQGELIATNVEYSATYGRRVVFVFENEHRKAFDVDEIHPEILSALGIDAEQARKKQTQQEQQHRIYMAKLYQQAQVRNAEQAKLAKERKAAAEKAAAERARLAEEQRRQQFQEYLQMRALENDRLRAQAAMQAADAAILDALAPKPSPIIVNPRPPYRPW